MVDSPTWNGSAWSAPTCVPNTPPSPLQSWSGNPTNWGYFTTRIGAAGSQVFQLRSDGTWSVARSGFTSGVVNTTGNPSSGTWTSDSSKTYEYTLTQAQNIVGNMNTVTPTTTITSWTPLSNIALTAKTPGAGTPEGDGKWTINIRQQGTVTPVLTINVELDTANGD